MIIYSEFSQLQNGDFTQFFVCLPSCNLDSHSSTENLQDILTPFSGPLDQVVASPATYVATVRDAENYVSRLQAHGTLPSGPDWIIRLRIEAGKTHKDSWSVPDFFCVPIY